MNLQELHETDFNLWVKEMKIKIKNRDVETLAIEILFQLFQSYNLALSFEWAIALKTKFETI